MQPVACGRLDNTTSVIVCKPVSFYPSFAAYQPSYVSAADWASLTTNLSGVVTVPGYLDFLTAEARRLATLGVRTPDVDKLMESVS